MQRPQNHKRPWKFIDSFSDPISEKCVQNHNNFLSLLPPPPPRTMPKILPPNLYPQKTGVSAIKTMASSQVQDDDNEWINKISEAIKNPVEEKPVHYNQTGRGPLKTMGNSQAVEDDNEWINKISETITKPAQVAKGCSSSYSNFHGGKSAHYNQTGGITTTMGNSQVQEDDYEWISKISEAIKKPAVPKPINFSKSAISPVFNFQSSCSNQMGMPSFNGGQRFAPAVQIRSVIPVCAAPPPPKEASQAKAETAVASTLSKLKLT